MATIIALNGGACIGKSTLKRAIHDRLIYDHKKDEIPFYQKLNNKKNKKSNKFLKKI